MTNWKVTAPDLIHVNSQQICGLAAQMSMWSKNSLINDDSKIYSNTKKKPLKDQTKQLQTNKFSYQLTWLFMPVR